MTKLMVPVVLCMALYCAGLMVQANVVFAALTDCVINCRLQEKICKDKVKDSPNDIERVLCEDEQNACHARCQEESIREDGQLQQERTLKEQEEKAQWDLQDSVSPESRSLESANEKHQVP